MTFAVSELILYDFTLSTVENGWWWSNSINLKFPTFPL